MTADVRSRMLQTHCGYLLVLNLIVAVYPNKERFSVIWSQSRIEAVKRKTTRDGWFSAAVDQKIFIQSRIAFLGPL